MSASCREKTLKTVVPLSTVRFWAVAVILAGQTALSAQTVLHVEDFGAIGDGIHDDGPALRAAAVALSNTDGPTVLSFGYGRTYRMGKEPSAHGSIVFQNAKNLTIEGNGSTIVNHPDNRTLVLYGCENVVLRNISLDMDPPPFTQGKIVALDSSANSLDVRIDPGYPLPATGTFSNNTGSDVMLYHRDTREPVGGVFSRRSRVDQLGENTYRVFFYAAGLVQQAVVGDFVTIKTAGEGTDLRAPDGSYIATGAGLILIHFSDHVTFEGVTSYASPGMTVRATSSDHLTIRRFALLRKPGTNRLIGGNKDGLHLKYFRVPPVIEDSRFEAGMDDTINLSQPPCRVDAILAQNRVEVVDSDIALYNIDVRAGDTLLHYRLGAQVFGEHTVTMVEPVNRRRAIVTVTPAFSGDLLLNDTLVVKPREPARLRRVEMPPFFQRGLLLRLPAVVEDIRQYGGARFVQSAAAGVEGTPPYEQSYLRGFAVNPGSALQFEFSPVANRPGTYSAIIRDSVIGRSGVNSVPVRFTGTDGVVFSGNRIVFPQASSAAVFSEINTANTVASDNALVVASFSNRETTVQISPLYRFGGLLGDGAWSVVAGGASSQLIGGEITASGSGDQVTLENNDIWMHGHLLERVIVVARLPRGGEALLRWRTEDGGYSQARQLTTTAANQTGVQTLVFETAGAAGWPNQWIRGLQLILPAASGEPFGVRYIALSAGDADRDGIHDLAEGSFDRDGDGLPDLLDRDSDGDGLEDSVEGTRDSSSDGVPDRISRDSSGDGVPDWFHWNRFAYDPARRAVNRDEFRNFLLGPGWQDWRIEASRPATSFTLAGTVPAGRIARFEQSGDLRQWQPAGELGPFGEKRSIQEEFLVSQAPVFMRVNFSPDGSTVLAHENFLERPDLSRDGGGRGFTGGFRTVIATDGSLAAGEGLAHPLKTGVGHSAGLAVFGPDASTIALLRGLDPSVFAAHSGNGMDIDRGTLYLAFLHQPAEQAGASTDRLSLVRAGSEVWYLEHSPNHADYRVHAGAANVATGVAPATGRTDLIVVRLDLDPAGPDTIRVYINPPDLNEPLVPQAQLQGEFSFREFALGRQGVSGTARWDEITWAGSFLGAINGATP